MQRLPVAHALVRDDARNLALRVGHGVVLEAFHQALGQRKRGARHQIQPPRGEPRREHGHGHNPALMPALGGQPEQHLAVGEHVRPAQIEALAPADGVIEHGRQVKHNVADAQRLAARVEPARRHHDGQLLDQIPDNLERSRPRPDNDAGPQHRQPLGVVAGQHVLYGRPRAQMHAQGAVVGDARQINYLPGRGPVEVVGEMIRRFLLQAEEITVVPAHRVYQVVGRVDVEGQRVEAGRVEQIGLYQAHLRVPGGGQRVGQAEAARVAHEADDLVAGLGQHRQQPLPDVAGGPGEQDFHGAGWGRRNVS